MSRSPHGFSPVALSFFLLLTLSPFIVSCIINVGVEGFIYKGGLGFVVYFVC